MCLYCADIISLEHLSSAFELRTLGDNCPLCKLLLDAVPRDYSGNYQQVPIVRDASALKIAGGGPRIIRLCADLGASLSSFKNITASLTTSH